jgi:D-sedoheptulose 7-phosphate isomerase
VSRPDTSPAPSPEALVARRFAASIDVPTRFFDEQADAVSHACLALARRFERGGRLLAFGGGAAASDAQHVAVEFVHPVLVGKRALPALALPHDGAIPGAVADEHGPEGAYAGLLDALARPEDIALGIAGAAPDPPVRAGLASAAQHGLLTIGLAGAEAPAFADLALDDRFIVPSADPAVIQETQEMIYHLLWELVHLFLDGRSVPS